MSTPERLAYYVPVEDVLAGGKSLVDHAKQKLLYNELSQIYDLAISRDTPAETSFLAKILAGTQAPVVDLGCGVGRHCGPLHSVYAFEMIGVDLSQTAILNAKARWPEVRFEVGDIRDIRLSGVVARAAICMWTTFNYLSSEDDLDRFRATLLCLVGAGGKLLLDLANPQTIATGVYKRKASNDSLELEVTVQKRFVRSKIIESIYQYSILDKENGVVHLATDQELNMAYEIQDVKSALGPSFALRETFGDYDCDASYLPDISRRLILLFERI